MEILSIARDTLVDIPACPRLDGTVSGAVNGAMFNSAFSRGGGPERDLTSAVACTMATVEYNTGVHITDHVVLDMAGVVAVVDALGGVHVDLPEPVVGNHHVDLDLPGGPQVLDGWQSLNFIRARGGSGMGLHTGSDLMRIERQQFFLNAVMATVVDQDLMTNLAVLYRVATGALNALTTSPGLASPVAVANLGRAMADMDPSHVVFTVVPVLPAPSDPHRVVWVQPDVGQMWERIAAGEAPDFPINERTD
jgi:LCP family protein required for cell wall assembly